MNMDIASLTLRAARAERLMLTSNVALTALLAVAAASVFAFPNMLSAQTPAGSEAQRAALNTQSISTAEISKRTVGKAPFRSLRVVAPKVVDELAAFTLTGISERDGQKRAYIRDTKQKRLLTKRVGDLLGSYEVTDIGRQGVSLTRGGQTVVLSRR